MNIKHFSVISCVIAGLAFSSCEKNVGTLYEGAATDNARSTKDGAYSFEIVDPQQHNSSYYRLLDKEESLWQWRVVEHGEFVFDMDIFIIDDGNAGCEIFDNGDGTYLMTFEEENISHVVISEVSSSNGTTTFTATNNHGDRFVITVNIPEEYDVMKVLMMCASNSPSGMKACGPILDKLKEVGRGIVKALKAMGDGLVECARFIEQAKAACEAAGCRASNKYKNTLLCGTSSQDPDKCAKCAALSAHC